MKNNYRNLRTKYYSNVNPVEHFTRCKQHWSRSTSCFSFLTLHKSWDKIQPTEHILGQRTEHHISIIIHYSTVQYCGIE